ncbi:MAG: cytochrome C biogenesis protein [Candidatus Aegiribacteria sp.]|nr:cytochrome C biogenesis protein [Candidatus Aegiribacteria sp.]MBD3294341.1 cytochrome C biogenesis protein [Candidatus Fermentibacteria bacterium]
MLREIFVTLTELLYAAPVIAIASALAWGILSMILSPCHLVSIPLIVGYVEKQSESSEASPVALSTIFAAGMIVAIALTAIITGLLGRIIGDIGTVGYVVLSVAVIYAGLSILGWVPLPLSGSNAGKHAGKMGNSRWGGFILGLIFGAALGPCTFAFMAPVLGLILAISSEQLLLAVGLGVAFAMGHGGVVVLAGSQTERIEKLAGWSGRSRSAAIIKIISGLLVVLGGIYLFLKALKIV